PEASELEVDSLSGASSSRYSGSSYSGSYSVPGSAARSGSGIPWYIHSCRAVGLGPDPPVSDPGYMVPCPCDGMEFTVGMVGPVSRRALQSMVPNAPSSGDTSQSGRPRVVDGSAAGGSRCSSSGSSAWGDPMRLLLLKNMDRRSYRQTTG